MFVSIILDSSSEDTHTISVVVGISWKACMSQNILLIYSNDLDIYLLPTNLSQGMSEVIGYLDKADPKVAKSHQRIPNRWHIKTLPRNITTFVSNPDLQACLFQRIKELYFVKRDKEETNIDHCSYKVNMKNRYIFLVDIEILQCIFTCLGIQILREIPKAPLEISDTIRNPYIAKYAFYGVLTFDELRYTSWDCSRDG